MYPLNSCDLVSHLETVISCGTGRPTNSTYRSSEMLLEAIAERRDLHLSVKIGNRGRVDSVEPETGKEQPVHGRVLIVLAALALAIIGCSSQEGSSPVAESSDEDAGASGPYDPDAEMRPELMEPEPSPATPGEAVSLSFPEETARGVMFVLGRQTGDSWEHLYFMLSDSHHQPATFRPGAEDLDWDDVGIRGPGPDRVELPGDLQPGDYRVCTENAGPNFCAPIEITNAD